jgi:hypothetical protein
MAALSGHAFAASNTAVGLCSASGNHYTTIQAAVSAVELLAAPRTVRVCPGTYPEQVNITAALTLEGVVSGTSDAAVVLPPSGGLIQNGLDAFGNPVAAQIFVAAGIGNSVTVEHLTVDGTGNNNGNGGSNGSGCALILEGIYFQNTPGTITYNAVRNQYQTDVTDLGGCQNGLAINVESLTSSNSVTISYNSVHSYQKNGITANGAETGPGSLGPVVTIKDNYITGLGATALNWMANAPAAENGIQVAFGATGVVSANTVNDHIWEDDTNSQPYNAAAGILVYASTGVSVTNNYVGSAQFAISTDSDPTYGPGDSTTITGNKVLGTQIFDGIDICSSSNHVSNNTIDGSAESGVHVDDSCGSGDNNTVTSNNINEACAGVLTGTGSGNTVTPNTFNNVTNTTLAGDVCPAGPSRPGAPRALRPSPYLPIRK